jgi:hypothetical protein
MAQFPSASLNVAVDAVTALDGKFSLHTADPGVTGANEVVGGSYARVNATWAAAAAGVAHPSASATFNVPAGTTISYFGMWTNAGVWVGGGPLSAPETFTGAGTYTLSTATSVTATS